MCVPDVLGGLTVVAEKENSSRGGRLFIGCIPSALSSDSVGYSPTKEERKKAKHFRLILVI